MYSFIHSFVRSFVRSFVHSFVRSFICSLILLGFTQEAKLVSSKHLTQVHLNISTRTLENLASHMMKEYISKTISQ